MTQATSDPFGSLTALFTSDAPQEGSAGGADSAPVAVVLVGNLPVNAGLWTTQLADEAARHAGPTALVRFERDEVTVELLRADGRTLPAPAPDAVMRWLPQGAAVARRWVVCVPAETAPADILAAGGDVLLMTGADEAAVVHAYHRLKHLADEATNCGEPLARIGLVVVGAADDRVDAVAAKLGEAARSFLGIELPVVARLPKLGRVESSARVTYASSEAPTLGELMHALSEAREHAAARFGVEPRAAAAHPRGSVAPIGAVPAPSYAPATPAAPMVAPAAPRARTAEVAATVSALPAGEPTLAPLATAAATVATPARLVPFLSNLRPLGVACPLVPDVELALDAQGCLQIIGRADQLARVRAAHTWAVQHQKLLGLAFPELAGQCEVLERLVLTDARDAIGLHRTGVLLDLLVEVHTPGGPVKAVVALNDGATASA